MMMHFSQMTAMRIKDVPVCKHPLATRGIHSSPQIWRDEKKKMDSTLWGSAQLWAVEGTVYDLNEYLPHHPGGQHWLELTRGQDITQLFISHHLNEEKAREALCKYAIEKCPLSPPVRFTFQSDGLFRQTKGKLLSKYSSKELQDTSASKKVGAFLVALWAICFWLMGYWQSYGMAVICAFLLIGVTGVAHNFVHMRSNYFKYLYLLGGFTPREWEIMHCLSHHSYANTLIDYEIQIFEPFVYYLRILPPNRLIFYPLKQLIILLLIPLNFLIKLIAAPLLHRTAPEWLYLVTLCEIVPLWAITNDILESVRLFGVMLMCFGWLFAKITFLGHRVGSVWTEGDKSIQDFGEHQVRASADSQAKFSSMIWSYLLFSGFNYHAVHHCFPTIDNSMLGAADVVLEEEARRLGIKRNRNGGLLEGMWEVEKHFWTR